MRGLTYSNVMASAAVFIALLRGLWRGRSTALPWAASGLVAALVHATVPGAWYVAAGALTGLAVAILAAERES